MIIVKATGSRTHFDWGANNQFIDIQQYLFSILLVKTFAFRRNRFSVLLHRVMMALGKEIHGISQRFSHGIQHPIPLCVGDKIPLPCSCRRGKLRVREIIRQICQQHDLLIEQGHVSKDHVHILVSAPTHLSESQIMQKIKGRSSRILQQEFPHLKKRYWGQHIWARGYFCTTVGQVTDQMIRDYIEGHVGKSPDDSFTVDED